MDEYYTELIPDPEEREPRESFVRYLVDILETILLSVVLFLAINAISARIRVDGYSMEPSLHNGEYVIVNKLTYRLDEPERGDIVVFQFPRRTDQEYIKRVIGLPGDEIRIGEGKVLVNGQHIQEPYINAEPAYVGTWEVPENEFFVLGDNRNNSSDSHNWGFVSEEYIIGKAVFVYWPPTEWGVIESPTDVLAAPDIYP